MHFQQTHTRFSKKFQFEITCVSAETLKTGPCHATSTIIIYKTRNISEKELLVFEIFPLEFVSKYLCIRRTARGGALSCHLFECHMLLIKKLQISARKNVCLSRYSRSNLFRNTSASREQQEVGPYRATSSIVICSWYNSRNFRAKELLVIEILPLEFVS